MGKFRESTRTMFQLKNGKTACAKPCTICVAALKDSIIEKVVYTTPEGFSVMNVGA